MTNYYKLTVPNDGTQTRFSIPASKAIFFKSATLADAETEAVKVILSKGANDVSGAFVALQGLIINDTDFDTITLSNDGSDTATVELFTSEGSFKFAGATSGGTATIPNPLEDTALKNPGAITQDNGNALEISATGANVDISGEQVTAGNNTLYGDDIKLYENVQGITGITISGTSGWGLPGEVRADCKKGFFVSERIQSSDLNILTIGGYYLNQANTKCQNRVDVVGQNSARLQLAENPKPTAELVKYGTTEGEPAFLVGAKNYDGYTEINAGKHPGIIIYNNNGEEFFRVNETEMNYSETFSCDVVSANQGFYGGLHDGETGNTLELGSLAETMPILTVGGERYIFDPDTGTFKKETT